MSASIAALHLSDDGSKLCLGGAGYAEVIDVLTDTPLLSVSYPSDEVVVAVHVADARAVVGPDLRTRAHAAAFYVAVR